ncbi:glycosyltransferase [Haliea sp. E1-2-M8]|uniref:glycosyltransferase n=1 Tax=Haliea sp. E1-2-M8 TaxID=3064706 RepID=UPI002728F9CD|nr:glycosyltransferase [Haliea sp. E1-2-M8]MDO8864176.1 glycosyltransferase [Haliea sp. E1-2-M8]
MTVSTLCRELGLAGWDVTIVTRGNCYEDPDKVLIPPIGLVNTLSVPKGSTLLSPRWSSLFGSAIIGAARTKYTIIHNHGLWLSANHISAVIAKKHRFPYVVSPRGMAEPWALQYKAWKKQVAMLLYQRRDLLSAMVLHATAESEAENLRRLGFRQPIAIIPNGVDMLALGKTLATEVGAKTYRKKHALFLSRLHPKKGLAMLVEAWSRVQPEAWTLTIAGPDEGGHRAEINRLIERKDLCDVIRVIDAVNGEEKTKLYRSADLFVLPTFSENFGVVVAEALACGVPVITTKGAPWQGLLDYDCGWWVDIGLEPLVHALREATSKSPQELVNMGENGKRYVEASFSWPMIARDMSELYSWVLGKRARPTFVY